MEEFSRRGSSVVVAVQVPTLSTELAELTDTLWRLFEEQNYLRVVNLGHKSAVS